MQTGAQPTVRPGDRVGGKYQVERILGQGGMAVVVAARHVELDELVAIKILLPHRAENDDVRLRFAREARAAAKIKSEHVARVRDVGALEDGRPYIVMEHLEGEDLASMIARRERLPTNEAVLYVLQACDALREAHALGIVHRDVKPANLFVARSPGRPPRVKVLDFGISKVEDHDRRCTEAKEVLGSPWYMAPEQMQSARSAEARADIWSLGIILYELVTGRVPFDGDTMTEVIVHVLHDEPDFSPLPRALAPVVRRCLAKEPERRFADVDEMATALRALERGDVDEDDGEVVEPEELLPTPYPSAAALSTLALDYDDPTYRDSATAMASVIDNARPTFRPSAYREPRVSPDRSKWFVAGAMSLLGIAGAWLTMAPKPSQPTTTTAAVVAAPPAPDPQPQPSTRTSTPTSAAVETAAGSAVAASVVTSTPAPVQTGAGSAAVAASMATPTSTKASKVVAVKPYDDATNGFLVIRRHHAALQTCLGASNKTTLVASVTVSIDASGMVTSASGSSIDPLLARCVEANAKTWVFPAPGAPHTLQVPIRFSRN